MARNDQDIFFPYSEEANTLIQQKKAGKSPNEVVLRFWSKESKDAFLGQLIDGWGEGLVDFSWERNTTPFEAPVLDAVSFWDPSGEPKDEHYKDEHWRRPERTG